MFVGNEHTDVEKVKHKFISRSCKVQNGGLISWQLSFKQRLRDTASFYLCSAIFKTGLPRSSCSSASRQEGGKTQKGKMQVEGGYAPGQEVGRVVSSHLPLARIQSHDHAFLQRRLGNNLGVCRGRRGNQRKVWGTANWSLPCLQNMGSRSFIICLHPVSSFTRAIVRLNFSHFLKHPCMCVCVACVCTHAHACVCSHLFVPRLLQFSLFRAAFPLFSDQLTWM